MPVGAQPPRLVSIESYCIGVMKVTAAAVCQLDRVVGKHTSNNNSFEKLLRHGIVIVVAGRDLGS